MKLSDLPIHFYVPVEKLVETVPSDINDYWPWITDYLCNAAETGSGGKFYWCIQTYMYLRNELNCHLSSFVPSEGVVVTHSDFSSLECMPDRKRLFVCIKPDRRAKHMFANIYLVQNKQDPLIDSRLFNAHFVPHWPQPSLIPRDPSRREFKNICFIGNETHQLARELHGLGERIKKLGLSWRVVDIRDWNDYSTVDAIVAVRDFKPKAYVRKPSIKLINAWLAGVPAVLGAETAYRDLRRSEYDYIEVNTFEDVIRALEKLKNDSRFRNAMIDNASRRKIEFLPERNVVKWKELLNDVVLPEYRRWRSSSLTRQAFFYKRNLHSIYLKARGLG